MGDRLAGKRILIVEDEYFIATDLGRVLLQEQAVVIGPFARLEAGLRHACDELLDAAILDINLGGNACYTIADHLAERHIPYFFVTGYDRWALPADYRDIPRLSKPFPQAALLQILETLLEPRAAPPGWSTES